MAALTTAGIGARLDGDVIRVDVAPAEAARVTETLAAGRLWVTELRPDQASLEDVFLELTGSGPGAGGEEAA